MVREKRIIFPSLILGGAFIVSLVVDLFFETPWSNPYWYMLEFIVWGGAIALIIFMCARYMARGRREQPTPRDFKDKHTMSRSG